MNLYRPLCLVASLALAGCANSATFTTARTLPPGAIQHVVGLEIGGSSYGEPTASFCGDSTCSSGSPQIAPSYSLRGGVNQHFELGGKVALASAELNGKIQLVDTRAFALALAPRISLGTPDWITFARLPILATFQPTPRFSWTVRLGVGGVWGHTQLVTNTFDLANPLVEAGSTWMIQLAPTTWLALEASMLATVPFAERTLLAPTGAVGILFGNPTRDNGLR